MLHTGCPQESKGKVHGPDPIGVIGVDPEDMEIDEVRFFLIHGGLISLDGIRMTTRLPSYFAGLGLFYMSAALVYFALSRLRLNLPPTCLCRCSLLSVYVARDLRLYFSLPVLRPYFTFFACQSISPLCFPSFLRLRCLIHCAFFPGGDPGSSRSLVFALGRESPLQ